MTDIAFDVVSMTGFNENGENYFSSKLSNRLFMLEYFPDKNMFALSMGAVNVRDEKRDALRTVLRDELSITEEEVHFDSHYVSTILHIRDEWIEVLNRAIQCMEKWAKNHGVFSGCFVCGLRDDQVSVREVGGVRAFMCDACKAKLISQSTQKLSGTLDLSAEVPVGKSRFTSGLLAAVVAGLLTSLVLVFVLCLFPFPWIFGTLAAGLVVNSVYATYERNTERMDVKGFLTTSILSAILLMGSVAFCYYQLFAATFKELNDAQYSSASEAFPELLQILSGTFSFYFILNLILPVTLGFVSSLVFRWIKR